MYRIKIEILIYKLWPKSQSFLVITVIYSRPKRHLYVTDILKGIKVGYIKYLQL